MTLERRQRIIYLDLLRIVGVFAVIVLHVAAAQWYITPVVSYQWQIMNVFESLTRFCVPLMIMISGVFFLDPDKMLTIKQLYHKYILRIVVAFLFWSLVYAVVNLVGDYQQTGVIDWLGLLKQVVLGRYHLTFLYYLVGLYMIVPVLRAVTKDLKLSMYYVLLFFSLSLVPNALKAIPFLSAAVSLFMNKFSFSLVGYAGYMVAGYYLSKVVLSRNHRVLIYGLGVVSVFYTMVMTSWFSIEQLVATSNWYGYLLPTTFLTTCAIFVWFKERFGGRMDIPYAPFISRLANLSFGVYLVHDLFNILLKQLKITVVMFNPVISIPLFALGIYLLSVTVSYGLSKIPFVRKYLV
jgi:surface polysaccharide O-acyltransferase-like enzyme